MKIMVNRFLIVVLFLFSALDVVAGPPPPTPTPPEVPINDNLIILIIIALFFGIRAIYKHKLKTKASI